MFKIAKVAALYVCVLCTITCAAQNIQTADSKNYLALGWKQVATGMPSAWYGSKEAKLVAENVMIAQKEIGGWAKNIPYHHLLSDSGKAAFIHDKSKAGATFDNDATTTELKFLAKVYAQIPDLRYKQAFDKGVNYLLISQYKNGGWPQYYPVKDSADEVLLDHTAPYSMHITYNDAAMVNTMRFLEELFTGNKEFVALQVSNSVKVKARKAFDMGINCFLKSQIVVNNKPTVWCAQHNEITLAPTNARAYELASFSGSESVDIVLMLMETDHPSKQIIDAVKGAVTWFETHKVEGIRVQSIVNAEGQKDRVVIKDESAPALWARFYDLSSGKPFFCNRDGIKRATFAELGYERRNGYSWYTTAPEKVLNTYPAWIKKWSVN